MFQNHNPAFRRTIMNKYLSAAITIFIGLSFSRAGADPGSLNVDLTHPKFKISPTFYGLMTEEINHSYDGGLYGELVQNRSFQDNEDQPDHWSLVKSDASDGDISLDETNPVNTTALTRSLKLEVSSVSANGRVGVANEGFWGIPVYPNAKYTASFYARSGDGLTGPLTVNLESDDGTTVYATFTVPAVFEKWTSYAVTLKTSDVKPTARARLVISTGAKGTLWLSMVSLFPPTFNDRPNGNRIDLMQMLGDLHPTFLRFPGGNYLEGDAFDQRFDWKKTIGSIDLRPGHQGPWRYRSSDGLGLLEFLEWCEDLHMQPVLAVFAGYVLTHHHAAAGPELQPYVRDALDEIEYCTSDASTKWGHERALDGHPDPFKIQYVEIGNEDTFDRPNGNYDARFAQFYDAIKAKYPTLQLIATAPVESRTPDVIDDHYYRSSRAMERDVHHYDNTDRKGPKIFVGEWATTEGRPTPNYGAALADAAWLTGLERNSDIIVMNCYAPLLVNVNTGASQWGTNLIGYNAISSFGSASYQAQKMFSQNMGDTELPVDITEQKSDVPPPTPALPTGAIGVATWNTEAQFKDIKVTQADNVLFQSDFSQNYDGWRARGGDWSVQGGALTQASDETNCRMTTGDNSWTDYTYTLKAKKTSGREGFLVMFHVRGRNDLIWWNVGGWADTRSQLEQISDGQNTPLGASAPVTIDTDRWYDVRIELKGADIKCYLDDKLITEATDTPPAPVPAIYACASRVDSTGQVILKVVNSSPNAQTLQVNLTGATDVSKDGHLIVITGKPQDVNSIDQPTKISPRELDIHDAGTSFAQEFPSYSVSVLKLTVKN
jgi:alpha-L-arabinofuranosidase